MKKLSTNPKNVARRNERARVKAIIKRSDYLRNLLKDFDAKLYGFGYEGEGISFLIKVPNMKFSKVFDLDNPEWKWLEALLLELKELRKLKKD